MVIRSVDACRPGSCHDAFIWRMSDAKRHFREKYQNGEQSGIILGDSGYGLEPYLMTPYKNPTYGTNEHLFNKKHTSARNIVERTIGNLKLRFCCLLSTSLHYSPQKVVKIVNVCCALHNICKRFNIEYQGQPNQNVDDPENDNNFVENYDFDENFDMRDEAVIIRNNIANNLN